MWSTECRVLSMKYGVWCNESGDGLFCIEFGVQRVVYLVWCMECGILSVQQEVLCIEFEV